jgi:hypothetical protein
MESERRGVGRWMVKKSVLGMVLLSDFDDKPFL